MNSKYYVTFLLIITIALGFILRIYSLSNLPPGFFCDEAATGYNAYTILHTARDEYGVFLPVFFRSFGNFRPGFPMYFTVPFVLLFGLNETSVRLASAVIGTLTVLGIFLLTKQLTKSSLAALLAALFLAISPWHIQFSRYSEGNIYLPFFVTYALYLFLLGLGKKSVTALLFSALCFGLGFYTYFQAYFLIPLIIVLLSILYSKTIIHCKKLFVTPLLLFGITLIPFFMGIPHGEILARFFQVSTSNQDKSLQEIIVKMATTYKDHFMPSFLFLKGDIGYPTHFITRFSVKNIGELYLLQLPLILFGFAYFLKWRKTFLLLIFLLLIYPLGSTLAPFADGGGPFTTRSIIGVIPFQILSGAGVIFLLKTISYKNARFIFLGALLLAIFFSVKDYTYKYFHEYPLYSADFWGWQYGPKPIMNYFLTNQSKYDDLVIVGNFNAPDIFIKFYDPTNQCNSKCRIGSITDYQSGRKQLFAIGADRFSEIPSSLSFEKLQTILYPNTTPAFHIGELKSKQK